MGLTKEDKAFNQAILLASQSMVFDFLCDDELVTISESNAFPFSISVGRKFVIIPKNIKYGLYTFYVDGVSRFNHGMIIYPHNWKEDVKKKIQCDQYYYKYEAALEDALLKALKKIKVVSKDTCQPTPLKWNKS